MEHQDGKHVPDQGIHQYDAPCVPFKNCLVDEADELEEEPEP